MSNKLFEESELNYIPGIKISTEEQELIKQIINYKESNEPIFNILPFNFIPCNRPLFKTHDLIKWHVLIFEVITKNKKQYYKFECDETLYSFNNSMSYIKLKKQLFLYFKRLLYLVASCCRTVFIDCSYIIGYIFITYFISNYSGIY